MADAPVEQDVGNDIDSQPQFAVTHCTRRVGAVGPAISVAANIIAVIGTFLFLVLTPSILLDFADIPDEFATVLLETVPLALPERIIAALGVALCFLITGIGFQVWQHRKGVARWWPLVLAFPISGVVLLPDALARGGSFLGWAMLAAAVALAFCVHWLFVLAAIELID